jgi:hypothetical protein
MQDEVMEQQIAKIEQIGKSPSFDRDFLFCC